MVLPYESFEQANQHILFDLPLELGIGSQCSERIVLDYPSVSHVLHLRPAAFLLQPIESDQRGEDSLLLLTAEGPNET
jgi:hypothetical protein